MRIGIIIGSLGLGGAERVSVRLAEWWVNNHHEVTIFTTMNPPEKEYLVPPNVKRVFCHLKGGGWPLVQTLKKKINSEKPDIAIVMDTPMCVYAVPALLCAGVPFVVAERSDPKNAKIKTTTRILSRTMMRFAKGFIFQTKGARDYFGKAITNKSTVIFNPLSVNELPSPHVGEREKTVVAMGRLISAKNYPLLIRAFEIFSKDHPDYTLEIYGEGAQRTELERILSGSPFKEKIHLNGSRSDVLQCIVTAGIFVLSSDYEGMPNALLEAMALGIPSIATDCPPGGPAELIVHNENGLLVSVGKADSLAEAMNKLADDVDFALCIGKRAISVREKLNIDVVADLWLKFLEKCL